MKKFTLIELLVVIAIIGILTSILMPALSKARESVKTSVCLNNAKQLSTATLIYTEDSVIPNHWDADAGLLGIERISVYLGEIRNNSVLVCPVVSYTKNSNAKIYHYSMSANARGKLLDQIPETSKFVFWGDGIARPGNVGISETAYSGFWEFDTNAVNYGLPETPLNITGVTRIPDERHNNQTVLSYADGHAGTSRNTSLRNVNFQCP